MTKRKYRYKDINRSAGAHNAGSIPATPSYGGRHDEKKENREYM